ncbi:MAG: DnaB-like helicase C-terminal domain-containing protein [Clostridia bacterium]|nr:DnaB-like helicase C-terminal domain-containing protein [Clostridia bacterium]
MYKRHDIVMFINRPDVNATDEDIAKKHIVKGMADLIVAKHRNGGLGRIKLRFKGEYTKFVNPEPDDGLVPPDEGQSAPPVNEELPPISEDDVPPEDEEMPF